ncbi:RNA polymerase sigma factor [Alicyclobacillus shizuokensis]|uniref:RNA polymerase sigma factor n=1 Tax=Alicyclobacillus shizuokensis TaxID=392014 RepID=UPI000834D3C8|nr:sigma factor-like helix-turn-helix DNA-binding protein [Alicyclobacillus shizuokensis]
MTALILDYKDIERALEGINPHLQVSPKSLAALARKRGMTKDDVLQEYALWRIQGTHAKSRLAKRINYQRVNNKMSIDTSPDPEIREFIVRIPAPVYQEDKTYDRVLRALRYWIRTNVLTKAQAEAIFFHDVEGWMFTDIAKLCGVHPGTVQYHYQNGIKRLRELYQDIQVG